MSSLEQLLSEGIEQQSLVISEVQQEKLIRFVHLLEKWNKVYNLTSIREKKEMVTLHLLDSLVVLPFFMTKVSNKEGSAINQVLDVGTGGGIPGIPLAICLPDINFVLLDARGKKIRFIQTVIAQLGLKNVIAVQSRVEDYISEYKFGRIISRAFASIDDMLNYCQHLCHQDGRFLAMKGQISEEEIAQLPEGFRIDAIIELNVPQLNAQRHLIQIVFNHES